MKKTFTINISGSVFHIDDDAYEKLQRYLQMLNRHFGTAAEGQEILQDIEARIAELFIEKTNNKVDVVSDTMVEEMIVRMGRPEDFMEADDEETSEKTSSACEPEQGAKQVRRRLYRDGDNRVFGGVCSGMAAYFNMDPVILRVIFFLLFFVIGPFNVLMYFILWIAVPKAKTTIQRLEMRGKEATVSNIEKTIKEEVNEVGESFSRFKNSPVNEKAATRINRFGDVVGSVLKVVLRVVVLVFGAALIIFGIASLIGFVATMAVGHTFMSDGVWDFGGNSSFDMAGLIDNFVSPEGYFLIMTAIVALVGIPILLVLFIGTKLLFRYKTNNRMIGLGAFGAWLLALVVLIIAGVSQAGNFSKQTSQTVTSKVECVPCKTLYLEMTDDLYETLINNEITLDRMKIAEVNGKDKILGHPKFTIEKSSTGDFQLQIKKKARGSNTLDAQKNIEQIDYNYTVKDSTLWLDPYYFLKDKAKWREQEVSMILKVPEGKSVFLNSKMESVISDIENVNNMWNGDMLGKFWTMTPDGLKLKETIAPTIKK